MKTSRHATGIRDPVDVHIGERIRLRRKLLGMSRAHLAERLGVSWQQLQKYEKAANRIFASRLWDMAETLDVPLSFFLDGLPALDRVVPVVAADDPMRGGEALEFLSTFHRIADPVIRRLLLGLIRAAGRADDPDAVSARRKRTWMSSRRMVVETAEL